MLGRTDGIATVHREQMRRLLDAFAPLIQECTQREPTFIERAALGALLHTFYQSTESIFTQISARVDRVLPAGDQWHRQLLDQMARPMESRTAVISIVLRDVLAEYLGFRHLFRNISPLDLNWERMAPLVSRLESTFQQLEAELDAFFAGRTEPEV